MDRLWIPSGTRVDAVDGVDGHSDAIHRSHGPRAVDPTVDGGREKIGAVDGGGSGRSQPIRRPDSRFRRIHRA
ncbi:hypothetical protein PUNSTDRAFT_135635 [Punctularia strigosozonata HHB-11173 SS5]|uniref:uncharacterized protein n=1 Tax=Punctularia strigosozonata (strain HHB-11173) TaxID=741275 RepID=UPI0004417FAB|nr:uncharacterized protein PUNSTDRAFT_135635 [Punctularia strigosozonata HHB-11173 SS5]EIN08122.1 hypothetical protein PUNSTDRAFT_135635 [Punctularia strigosozonata HHB-11173 SS5]